MAMEHKAFIFDTNKFNQELRQLILTAGKTNDPQPIKQFITNNFQKLKSPYTGEALYSKWETELASRDVQEYADFALTCFYSPEDDFGLAEAWDALLESFKRLFAENEAEYYILGKPLKEDTFTLDPGGMGMGFVEAKDILEISRLLRNNRDSFIKNGLPPAEDLLYELSMEELIEAYNDLFQLYQKAARDNKGLLMTF